MSDACRQQPIQDGGYSWVVLFASFMLTFHFSFSLSHMGVLIVEYKEYFSVRQDVLIWISAIHFSVGFFLANISAVVVKKCGFRLFGFLCSVISCISLIMTAAAPNVAVIYIGTGVGAGVALFNCYFLAVIASQTYFSRRRALANAIVSAGISAGVFIWPFVCRLCIDEYGWRGAMAIMAALNLHTLVYSALLRPQPVLSPEKPDHLMLSDRPNLELQACNPVNQGPNLELQACNPVSQGKIVRTDGYDDNLEMSPEQAALHEDTLNIGVSEQIPAPQSAATCGTNAKIRDRASGCDRNACKSVKCLTFKSLTTDQILYTVSAVLIQSGFINFFSMCPTFAAELGISKLHASAVMSIYGVMGGIMRLVTGFVADHKRAEPLVMLLVGGTMAGVAAIMAAGISSFHHMAIFSAFYALPAANYMALTIPALRGIVGLEHLPEAAGFYLSLIGLDHLAAVFLAGSIAQELGSVAYTFVLFGSVQLLASCGYLVVYCRRKGRCRARREQETG